MNYEKIVFSIDNYHSDIYNINVQKTANNKPQVSAKKQM